MNKTNSILIHSHLESWHTVLVLSVISLVSQSIATSYLFKIELNDTVILLRSSLLIISIINIFVLVWFKNQWKEKYSRWLFYAILVPLFLVAWMSQSAYVESGKLFTPYLPYKLYPIVLAFFAPVRFWFNFLIITLFYVQATVFWFYYDMPNVNASIGSEPFGTLVFGLVAFTILIFRHRDKKIIRDLSRDQANLEFYQTLTKIFLSLRDRANTPLQMQKLGITLLENKYPEEKELLHSISNATNDLARINKILDRIHPSVTDLDQQNYLMTDEELLKYLDQIGSNGA